MSMHPSLDRLALKSCSGAALLLALLLLGSQSWGQQGADIGSGIYTEQQALAGEAVYREHCAECHRADLTGQDMSPSLVGIGFTFTWQGRSLQELYTSMRRGMPQTAPGSLSNAAYAELTAFLLWRNGYPAGAAELPVDEDWLAGIRIVSPP